MSGYQQDRSMRGQTGLPSGFSVPSGTAGDAVRAGSGSPIMQLLLLMANAQKNAGLDTYHEKVTEPRTPDYSVEDSLLGVLSNALIGRHGTEEDYLRPPGLSDKEWRKVGSERERIVSSPDGRPYIERGSGNIFRG